MANKANPSNKPVAVVTGVGPGLGAALARRFAATYAVAILARKADYLKALAGEIRQSGATVMDVPCDVGDRAQMARAFDATAPTSASRSCCSTMLAAVRGVPSPRLPPNSTKRTGASTR